MMKSDLGGSSIDANLLVIRGGAVDPPPAVGATAAAATADEVAALAPGVIGAVAFFLVLFTLMAAYWRCVRSSSSWQRPRQGKRGEVAHDADVGGTSGCNITVNPLMAEEEKGSLPLGRSEAAGGRDFRVELELQTLERLAESDCNCDDDDASDCGSSSSSSGSSSAGSSEADCDECRRDLQLLAKHQSGNEGCRSLAQLASSEDEFQDDDDNDDEDCDFDDNGEGPAPVESARLIVAA